MKRLIALVPVFVLLAGCATAAPPSIDAENSNADGAAEPAAESAAPEENLAGCVEDYTEGVDYFPEKAEITDADNFSVAYFDHYKVVTVLDAFDGAEAFSYVLVQCGTPAPEAAEFPEGTQFIEVPADDMVAMSTTQLPHLTVLGLLDRLVGVDNFLFISSPEVQALIDEGALVEVGSGADVNIEQVLDLDPDLVMTFGFDPDTDAHPILIDAGISTALNAEWREDDPLARAEWIKYTALFFNAEAEAETAYADIASAYESARELAASVPAEEQPVVLWNSFSPFAEAGVIPGAETFVGALITDAGGQIALTEEAPGDSALLSFETVYANALDADIWVANSFTAVTLDDLLAEDPRYVDFEAVQDGEVWNDTGDVNANGGNNYYELGVTNPHLILRDLIAIFHPELLPDHSFNFYVQLEPAGE
ncbi:MAG: ABC transporter substrate-binding protein [Chloroflexi bacterium]|nr:ABC transporter substrate-binding protein [Chloroflexota bacterium]